MILLREALENTLKKLKIKGVTINNKENDTLKITGIKCGKTIYTINNVILRNNLTVKEREYLAKTISKRLEEEKLNILKSQKLIKEIFELEEKKINFIKNNNLIIEYHYVSIKSEKIKITNYLKDEKEDCNISIYNVNSNENFKEIFENLKIIEKLKIIEIYLNEIHFKLKELNDKVYKLNSCSL